MQPDRALHQPELGARRAFPVTVGAEMLNVSACNYWLSLISEHHCPAVVTLNLLVIHQFTPLIVISSVAFVDKVNLEIAHPCDFHKVAE